MKRYIFKYSAEPTKRGVTYRPVAHVLLRSSVNEWFLFYPYINSGADVSTFTKGDSELLNLNLYAEEYNPIMGVGRILVPAYLHNVKMRIGETVFKAEVAFADSDEVPRLLGRKNVFKHFKITFDETNLQTIFETLE